MCAEPFGLRDLFERRAGIGDRDEMLAPRPPRRAPPSHASKKYCLKMLGSSVVPDLLDTMNSVLFEIDRALERLDLRRVGRIEDMQRGKPGLRPNVSASTSGPRLDPPMPSSSTSVKPALFTSAAKALSLATSLIC